VEVVASLSQGRTAAAQCGLFTHKSVPVIYEPPCTLQAVQLHKRNINLSLLTAHSVHMKEIYENVDLLLKAMSYSKYGWKICGHLTVTGLLLGMQSGYTKFSCFLREWDSRTKENVTKLIISHARKLNSRGKVCQKSTAS